MRRPILVLAVGMMYVMSWTGPGAGAQPAEVEWVRTGGPLGGLGYDVRMRPDDPDVMFVTDAWAGVFRSDDGGRSWQPSNDGITTRSGPSGDAIPIFSLTIDPHDPDIVWVGTQNTRGIFRSADGGRTWTEKVNGIHEGEGITFRGFTVDPRSSDIVYAAAEIASWVWAGTEMPGREFDRTAGVVYKTLDGGESWFEVWRGDNLARYVWIDANDPDVVYVSTGIFDREAANSEPSSRTPGGAGVQKSVDGGATWSAANDGLGNLYVGSLYQHPDNPRVLLAGTGNNQYYDDHGAYLSIDGAASWSKVLPDDNITAVEFTSDPSIAYAGSEAAIYRSEDTGSSWEKVSGGEGWGPAGVRAGFPIDLQADPRNPDRLFVNNYGGGVFLSNDGGRTWASASAGYTGAQVRAIAVDPIHPGRVYAASRSGLFVSDDGGSTWRGLGFGIAAALEFHAIAVDPADPTHLLAATNWASQLMSSANGGRTWEPVGPQLGEPRAWRVIEFATAEPSVVYAGSGAYFSAGSFSDEMEAAGIYVSRDHGANWESANTELTAAAQVDDLAVHPQFVGFVFAASTTHGLLRTFDGGIGWERIDAGLPDSAAAVSVAFDPHSPDVVLAGFARHGLYRSEDGGDRWTRVAAGFNPESTISDIAFDPAVAGRVFAADQGGGVYLSDDHGRTFQAAAEGLRTRAVNALALTSDGGHLYAATEGEGVYRLDTGGIAPLGVDPLWTVEDLTPTTQVPEGSDTTVSVVDTTMVNTAPADETEPAPEEPGGTDPVVIGSVVVGSALLLAVAVLMRRRRA